MRVVVLHNIVPSDAPPEDLDTLVEVEAVAGALGRLGHAVETLACDLDFSALRDEIARRRPDRVFNMVESLDGDDSLVSLPPAVLDAMGVPYCGCSADSLYQTAHKILAKERLRGAGLPTPDWVDERGIVHAGRAGGKNCGLSPAQHSPATVDSLSEDPISGGSLRSTRPASSWILKGVWDQGSRGLDDAAVLHDATAEEVLHPLAVRAAQTRRRCFAERFIDGREFNVSLLAGACPDFRGEAWESGTAPLGAAKGTVPGLLPKKSGQSPEALPPAEIVFENFPEGKPRVVGHAAKWLADSFECVHTLRRFDFAESDGPLLERLRALALQCWRLFRLGGWARVDFRVDAEGEPWILEVNGNPCLSPDAGFAAALDRANISYDEAIRRILENIEPP